MTPTNIILKNEIRRNGMKFTEMGLSPQLLKAVDKMGFEEATPIQSETIPYALKGRDVLGQAQTGTGKTAAFGLPLLEKIDPYAKEVQALVISPTRELAIQTGQELYQLGEEKRVQCLTVYGGSSIQRQLRQLEKKRQVIVGTPGRLLDLIRRGKLDLSHIQTLVLDEADEMLNMGFIDDIEAIIAKTPADRQTLLFSATMPKAIQRIGEQFMQDPIQVKIKAQEMTADLIDQYFTRCRESEKFDVLTRFIDVQDPVLAIVFARTKRRVDEISRALIERGYTAEGLHGDLNQDKRSMLLRQFKDEKLDILVATDVAARGLDISNVTHVYNFDIPLDPDSYVHRIGRTGRAGRQGVSVTFVGPNELGYLRTIEDLTKKKMMPLRPPSAKEAFSGRINQALEEVKKLTEEADPSYYQEAIDYLSAHYSTDQLALAVLSSLTKDPNEVEVRITPERTPRKKSGGRKRKGAKRGNHKRSYQQHDKKGKKKSYQGSKDHPKGKKRGSRKKVSFDIR